MTKLKLGFLCIGFGLAYGSQLSDWVYDHTLGTLVKYHFVRPPPASLGNRTSLGRKPTIFLFSFLFIALGLFLIWNNET